MRQQDTVSPSHRARINDNIYKETVSAGYDPEVWAVLWRGTMEPQYHWDLENLNGIGGYMTAFKENAEFYSMFYSSQPEFKLTDKKLVLKLLVRRGEFEPGDYGSEFYTTNLIPRERILEIYEPTQFEYYTFINERGETEGIL